VQLQKSILDMTPLSTSLIADSSNKGSKFNPLVLASPLARPLRFKVTKSGSFVKWYSYIAIVAVDAHVPF